MDHQCVTVVLNTIQNLEGHGGNLDITWLETNLVSKLNLVSNLNFIYFYRHQYPKSPLF